MDQHRSVRKVNGWYRSWNSLQQSHAMVGDPPNPFSDGDSLSWAGAILTCSCSSSISVMSPLYKLHHPKDSSWVISIGPVMLEHASPTSPGWVLQQMWGALLVRPWEVVLHSDEKHGFNRSVNLRQQSHAVWRVE